MTWLKYSNFKVFLNNILWFYEYELILILHILGPPSATNYYLFNGDIVDKGQHSIEVSER